MTMGNVTTPFGRRPVTLALVKRQVAVNTAEQGRSAEKWRVFRDASEARIELGLQDRSLAVLDALLSFYPENELCHDAQMIVFPSNAQLTLRAHGIAGATLRRHLALLVNAGLIFRRDSANGKRYARKDEEGTVESAYGFDLSPLLIRAGELAIMAQKVVAERAAFRKSKECLTICRRDVRKLISAAIEEGAAGDWQTFEDIYVGLVSRIPRSPTRDQLDGLLDEMSLLRDEIVNRLEIQENPQNMSMNDAHIERHIQNSKSESFNEFEPRSEEEQGAKSSKKRQAKSEPLKAFPLSVVLKACPQVLDYATGGIIQNWRDLMSAGVLVRSALGISPSAYQDACEAMGPENAAIAVSCMLERSNLINSPGGYLRDLTRRSEQGEFSLGPMVMAQLRANGHSLGKTG